MTAEKTHKACLVVLLALLAAASLGHVQGLRGVLALVLGLCAATAPVAPPLRAVAAAWLVWLALGFASAAWSALPDATLRSALYELLLPCVVFLGAARSVANRQALDALALALLAGLAVLAGLSAYAHLAGNAGVLMTPAESKGVLRFHPGVGVASTFAALAYPIWLMQWRNATRWRVLTAMAVGCIVLVGLAAPNRMFWITLFGTTVVFLLAEPGVLAAGRRGRLIGAIALIAALSGALFVMSLYQRGFSVVDGWTKLEQSVTSESRFVGWAAWAEQASTRPVLGAGFGEAAARAAYGPALPRELAQIDDAMIHHAHNLLLNVQLQLGVVGLIAFLLVLSLLMRLYWRGRSDPRAVPATRAGVALVAAMLLKNATDDFMNYAIAIAFWALAGALAGFIARGSDRNSGARA